MKFVETSSFKNHQVAFAFEDLLHEIYIQRQNTAVNFHRDPFKIVDSQAPAQQQSYCCGN